MSKQSGRCVCALTLRQSGRCVNKAVDVCAAGGAPEAEAGPGFGPFAVTPQAGAIQPGEKAEITVVFTAAGNQPYREILGVQVHRVL